VAQDSQFLAIGGALVRVQRLGSLHAPVVEFSHLAPNSPVTFPHEGNPTGVPGAASWDATIDVGTTVTLDVPVILDSFNFGSPSVAPSLDGSAQLLVREAMAWSSGRIGNTITINGGATFALSGSAAKYLANPNLIARLQKVWRGDFIGRRVREAAHQIDVERADECCGAANGESVSCNPAVLKADK
jgi:hypothetical protein